MLIQKFGGTSLGRKGGLKRVTEIVKQYLEKYQVAVVVSAFSSIKKEEGVTSLLLQATKKAVKGNQGFIKIVETIKQYKLDLIKINIKNIEIKAQLQLEVEKELHKLKNFLRAISIIRELTSLSTDNIISIGEKLAAKVFAAVLKENKIEAKAIDLSQLVKKDFKEADPKMFKFVENKLKLLLSKNKDSKQVLVFTGFIGSLPNGILSALGRGYTDFTACLLAVTVKAKELQIWKEVDGIFSANPKIVTDAKLLTKIHPEETAELTYYGSEVVHPSTVDYAKKSKLPIRIKNTFNTEGEGTLIDINFDYSNKSGAIAVTCKKDIQILNIHSNKMLMAYGFMGKLFELFQKYQQAIDLIATSEVNVSLTLNNKPLPQQLLIELGTIGEVTIQKKMAIVSVVGKGLKNQVGIAGLIFSTLAESNINIEIISQGSSEINISCVVRSLVADTALIALHKKLIK